MRANVWRRVIALSLLLLLVATPSSTGHEVSRSDAADETDSLLNVVAAQQTHRRVSGARFVTFTLETEEPFTNDALRMVEGEYEAVAAGVSTDDHPKFERLIVVDVTEDAEADSGFVPYATVWTREDDQSRWQPEGDFLGYARVWRPTPASIAIEVPVRLLGIDGRTFRWEMRTVSSPDPGHVAFDYAPESGAQLGHTRR